MISLKVRRISDKYRDVIIFVDNIKVERGLHNDEEIESLKAELRACLEELE